MYGYINFPFFHTLSKSIDSLNVFTMNRHPSFDYFSPSNTYLSTYCRCRDYNKCISDYSDDVSHNSFRHVLTILAHYKREYPSYSKCINSFASFTYSSASYETNSDNFLADLYNIIKTKGGYSWRRTGDSPAPRNVNYISDIGGYNIFL